MTTNRTTQLEERLLELHEGGCDGCGGCVLIRKAAAIGAELAFEEAANECEVRAVRRDGLDSITRAMTDAAKAIRARAKEAAGGK